MATYYRWRKSKVEYVEKTMSVNDPIGIGYYSNENPDYIYTTEKPPRTVADDFYDFHNTGTKAKADLSTTDSVDLTGKYWHFIAEDKPGTFVVLNTNVMFYGGYITRNDGNEMYPYKASGAFTRYDLNETRGAFIRYVYSIDSSEYPNNDDYRDYWYDQRTTVTSPTAPTDLTYPNPITTQKVTVSWEAATSNVPDYPVDHYNVTYTGYDISGSPLHGAFGDTNSTSVEIAIPTNYASICFYVSAYDTNGQMSSQQLAGELVNVYLSPTLTVPSQLMQGQQATINWSAIEGADSYTLERKSSADVDWTQVYSGANLTFSEAVGTWTTVQYRVQAVFDGTPGGWAESAAIPVVSASSLVISGTDEDLGVVTNDIPYSISTDTGNQITATITVNNAVIFSGNVGNSTADVIPVLDLITGEGTIVISATVEASGGPVTATRTWTYEKAAITFPNSGGVAQLTQEGNNIFPKTLAECVRLPGGGTLDQVMGFPCQIYIGTEYGINNNDELVFPFTPKALLIFSGITLGLFIRGSNTGYCSVSSNSYEDSTLEWKENSIRFVDSPFAANQTYTYVCFG